MPKLKLENEFQLHYEVHGPVIGSAPAIIFAHGAGGNGLSWWQQVPAFSDQYTVITFDHRAFGRSPDIENGPGRTAFGTDTRALLDHLGLHKVHFVAHSMGGRTAFGVLSQDPERLLSITYSGTNGGCVSDEYRNRRIALEENGTLQGSLLQRAVGQNYEQKNPEMYYLYRRIRSINPPRPKDFLAPRTSQRNYKGTTADRLRDGGWPILWIVGEQDRIVPPELIHISHTLTPESIIKIVPNAGHSAYFEHPQTWNSHVRKFIDSVEEKL